jgi:hypothetical protein
MTGGLGGGLTDRLRVAVTDQSRVRSPRSFPRSEGVMMVGGALPRSGCGRDDSCGKGAGIMMVGGVRDRFRVLSFLGSGCTMMVRYTGLRGRS